MQQRGQSGRRTRHLVAGAAVLATAASVGGPVGHVVRADTSVITEYHLGSNPTVGIGSGPVVNSPSQSKYLTLGPDGAVWATEPLELTWYVDRVDKVGTQTMFAPTWASSPQGLPPPPPSVRGDSLDYGSVDLEGITAGADGNVWYLLEPLADTGPVRIARMTPSGAVTEYVLPVAVAPYDEAGINLQPAGSGIDYPGSLVRTGSTFWFVLPHVGVASFAPGPEIPAVSVQAGTVQVVPVSASGSGAAGTAPGPTSDLAVGPNDTVWFAAGNQIGEITSPTDTAAQYYALPSHSTAGNLTRGPGGSMWFAESDGSRTGLGRVTAAGDISEYIAYLPSDAVVQDLALGPDGNVWFTESVHDVVGRATPCGAVTEWKLPALESIAGGGGHEPDGIIAGPGGDMWFTEWRGDSIGRVHLDVVQAPPACAAAGHGVQVRAVVTGAGGAAGAVEGALRRGHAW